MNVETNRLVSVLLTLVNNTELSRFWTPLDERYLLARVEAEGLKFLTVELPKLAKALEAAMRQGVLNPIEGFKRMKNRVYPSFLAKAWETLFPFHPDHDYVEGDKVQVAKLAPELFMYHDENFMVRHSAHSYAGAVRAIRQICLMYYKTKLPYEDDQIRAVEEAFKASETALTGLDLSASATYVHPFELEAGMRENKDAVDRQLLDTALTRARHLVCKLLYRSDPMDILPQHGSGASSCKTNPWDRYKSFRFIPKLDAVYNYREWFYISQGVDVAPSEKEHVDMLEVCEEPLARVVYVPKDSRGPRLISTEPREYMFIQQGLMSKLYDAIGMYPTVKAQLDCQDQMRNKHLARFGSETGSVATLDLKEASDRVSLTLVERLFPQQWVRSLKACRSIGTVLPSGEVVTFRKFAPMGSAVCFPVEAICFWALANAAVALHRGYDWTEYVQALFEDATHSLETAVNQIAVFGDDIIVPTDTAKSVMSVLESVGLLVNRNKSFLRGPFRESCGGDFFLGEDVSYAKCRELPYATGSRNVMDRASFRTADWFNNLITRFGTYCLTEPLRALFEEWYGPVVVSTNVTPPPDEFSFGSVPSRGLLLLGHIRDVPESYRTQRRGRKAESVCEYFDISEREFKKESEHAQRLMIQKYDNAKRRGVNTTYARVRFNLDLDRLEVKVPIESQVILEIDSDDWSHLLRILLKGSGTQDASSWPLAKRCKYKYGWIPV
jgi:hypothetical protein